MQSTFTPNFVQLNATVRYSDQLMMLTSMAPADLLIGINGAVQCVSHAHPALIFHSHIPAGPILNGS
jgi:hypothetical protein